MAKQQSFATRIIKNIIKNEFAQIVEDGILGGDIQWYIDTGSYTLNALISGSIYNGIPNNNILAYAGKSGVGKTYYTLEACMNFQNQYKDGVVLYFESEGAIRKEMLSAKGIDESRFIIFPIVTIEEFRKQLVDLIEAYDPTVDPKVFVCLDSLGNVSTSKEVNDILKDTGKKDMTRAQLIKSTFRVITLKAAQKGIPLVLTNHTYSEQGSMYPKEIMSGGCFAPGTRIIMSDGSLKNIEDVVDGDFVKTGNNESHEVLQTHTFNDKEIYSVELEDGTVLECTGEHKFAVGIDRDTGMTGEYQWVDTKTLHQLAKYHDIDLVEVE